jgi:Tol biopolymer transport system component
MAYQFNASGVAFPITIHYRGVRISVPQPEASASFAFDAGDNPQPGQEWVLNQPIELAGHTLTLVSVDADSRGGYSFHFKTDRVVNGVGVSIEGYQPNGGGGGGGGGMTNGEINVSISYAILPTGKLTVVLSNLSEITDELEWTAQWSPDSPRTDIPATPQLAPGVCGNSAILGSLPTLPASINGKILLSQSKEDGSASLILSSLDGSGQVNLASLPGWNALSLDGNKVIYSSEEGYVLYDVQSGVSNPLNLAGYNPRFSPRADKVAYVDGAAGGIYVYDLQTKTNRLISSQAYSAVVGWSSDETKLYIAIMAAGGSAWQIQEIYLPTRFAEDGILIENGSYKWLSAVVSPDGKWIAYRGRDNSGIFLARMDGSETRLLLDNPAIGTSGIAWASNDWLGVSLMQDDNTQKVILVNPSTCETWLLSNLNGAVQGLTIK